ncbi:hypothetical protein VDGL01_05474 [Verticillium dahliae]
MKERGQTETKINQRVNASISRLVCNFSVPPLPNVVGYHPQLPTVKPIDIFPGLAAQMARDESGSRKVAELFAGTKDRPPWVSVVTVYVRTGHALSNIHPCSFPSVPILRHVLEYPPDQTARFEKWPPELETKVESSNDTQCAFGLKEK